MTQKRPVGQTSGMRSRNASTSTRPRAGVAARELQEARRKKRQREVMRNRIIFGAGCLLVLALVIFLIVKLIGALISGGGSADGSTLTFKENGQLVFEEVVDFDSDVYSKSELKSYTKELIDSFNDTYGEDVVSLNKIKVSGDTAYIKTTYEDADCYSAFTNYQAFSGTYEEAVEAGYDFEELFGAVSEGTKAEGTTVDAEETFAGMNVAIIKENVTVVVSGDITYVSDTSTSVVDAHTVSIEQADGNEDATDLVYVIYK